MDGKALHWGLIVLLLVVPMLLVAVLKLVFRRRGGIESGWGGMLLVGLCWITALILIVNRVVA